MIEHILYLFISSSDHIILQITYLNKLYKYKNWVEPVFLMIFISLVFSSFNLKIRSGISEFDYLPDFPLFHYILQF